MIRIKSITDVITNSSTEVFTCNTDKSLEEVSELLSKITSGYCDPEIMTKDKGVLRELINFGYVVDIEDPESYNNWVLSKITQTEYYDDDTDECVEIPHSKELKLAFGKYIWKNLDYIREYTKSKFSPTSYMMKNGGFLGSAEYIQFLVDENTFLEGYMDDQIFDIFNGECYPKEFMDDFFKSYEGELPETLVLKDEFNSDTYVGKIGFMGKDDNSIPYETFNIINTRLNATNWHLG